MQGLSVVSAFNEAVEELLGRTECRVLSTPDERAAAYRLRYESYLKEGAIAPNSSRSLTDRFDDLPTGAVYGFYIDGNLASTIRLNVATPTCRDIPATTVFADVLRPYFDAGKVVLDPTRFVLDEEHARAYPKLAYVTLRIAWLATEYFDVDYTLASVRLEHQAFYRRFYGHRVICPPRPYPTLIKPLSLMLLDFRPTQERGLQRYPFLRSTPSEKRALFGGICAMTPSPLVARPCEEFQLALA